MSPIFSNEQQLEEICKILSGYIKLPFSASTIPGSLMEAVLATVRGAKVLNTYDFVDVIDQPSGLGWQVKATKSTTPLTWKRAKIANSRSLIDASLKSDEGLQALGDAIIDFCNAHILESLEKYNLDAIGYSRLLIFDGSQVGYYEKLLATRKNPILFHKEDYAWKWSVQKKTSKKEQLQALHGYNKKDGTKEFAWHGLGENQLHFSGERKWWPDFTQPKGKHHIVFEFPGEADRLTLQKFAELLSSL